MNVAPSLQISDTLQINKVLWLQSLPETELGPSRRINEDLESLASAEGLAFEQIAVPDRATAFSVLDRIADESAAGLRPILHFDCHGSVQNGLLLAPSGDHLSWKDLAARLRAINVATQNNLCCVFAACFGLYIGKEVELSKPAPFFLVVGAENEINVGYLEEKTLAFYRAVLRSENISKAYQDILFPELRLFNCKGMFAQALARYVARYCSGKAGATRRERLVEPWLALRGLPANRANLRIARKAIKDGITPSQSLIDRFAATFLIGRSPGFGISELRRLAEGQRRS